MNILGRISEFKKMRSLNSLKIIYKPVEEMIFLRLNQLKSFYIIGNSDFKEAFVSFLISQDMIQNLLLAAIETKRFFKFDEDMKMLLIF